MAGRTGNYIVRHSGWFIGAVLALTALFALPILFMERPGPASQDPGGPVFDLLETVNQRFPPRIHVTTFIVEDPLADPPEDQQRDILRQQPLWDLYRNERKLRASELGSFLYKGYDADNERQILGVYTIADAVQNLFLLDPRRAASAIPVPLPVSIPPRCWPVWAMLRPISKRWSAALWCSRRMKHPRTIHYRG
ncbi:MAG TPA: hypothetical protein EYO17_10800 [Dehalococcoidia bacterium]|nr:hypothetical protein [Dehalococcoidia bacterium]